MRKGTWNCFLEISLRDRQMDWADVMTVER